MSSSASRTSSNRDAIKDANWPSHLIYSTANVSTQTDPEVCPSCLRSMPAAEKVLIKRLDPNLIPKPKWNISFDPSSLPREVVNDICVRNSLKYFELKKSTRNADPPEPEWLDIGRFVTPNIFPQQSDNNILRHVIQYHDNSDSAFETICNILWEKDILTTHYLPYFPDTTSEFPRKSLLPYYKLFFSILASLKDAIPAAGHTYFTSSVKNFIKIHNMEVKCRDPGLLSSSKATKRSANPPAVISTMRSYEKPSRKEPARDLSTEEDNLPNVQIQSDHEEDNEIVDEKVKAPPPAVYASSVSAIDQELKNTNFAGAQAGSHVKFESSALPPHPPRPSGSAGLESTATRDMDMSIDENSVEPDTSFEQPPPKRPRNGDLNPPFITDNEVISLMKMHCESLKPKCLSLKNGVQTRPPSDSWLTEEVLEKLKTFKFTLDPELNSTLSLILSAFPSLIRAVRAFAAVFWGTQVFASKMLPPPGAIPRAKSELYCVQEFHSIFFKLLESKNEHDVGLAQKKYKQAVNELNSKIPKLQKQMGKVN